MSIVGDIKNLYSDVEKTRALFPTTKIEAVSDEDGTGLNVILDKMAYVGHGADQVKNLYADKTETQAIFPTTKVKAVSDENGRSLDVLLDDKASKDFVTTKIAEAQLGGGGSDGADGFSPIATVVPTEDGALITITDKNGTTMATVKNGADGAKGDKGDTGSQGPKGDTGPQGPKGDTGATGATGKDGTSVTHAWNGTTLTITSASGSSSTNLKGAKGDQGIQGIQGEPGADGAKGDKGDAGADGKSAYQYAQDGGFEGTEEEFAEKLAKDQAFEFTVTKNENGSCWASADLDTIVNAINAGKIVTCRLLVTDATQTAGDKIFNLMRPGKSGSSIVFAHIHGCKTETIVFTKLGMLGTVIAHNEYDLATEEYVNDAMESVSGYPAPCVMDYGAKGDGNTDDTVAFQTALAENRVVFVPGGTYKLNGTLVIRENCCLELSQDTVLRFQQTYGNCIEMRGSATLNGNHANIYVPYGFTGHIIDMDTVDDKTNNIPPYKHWDPMWKRGRYVYDVCLVKEDPTNGFHYSLDGTCSGTAIYMSAEGTAEVGFIWGAMLQGIRIAGAFTYGIHVINFDDPNDSMEDDAWNHDMRIEAVFQGCETSVSMTNCNNAHLAVTVQCSSANNGTKYAKWGVRLDDCKNIDMSGSNIWDWHSSSTASEEYTHVALYGYCPGLILSDMRYNLHSADVRESIYTDTPSNRDSMIIMQEPITRWFKPKDHKPYFFNGDTDKEILLREDFDNCFTVGKTPTFTDVLAKAIDSDGSIYNGIGYSRNGGCINGSGVVNSAQTVYGHTGFIAVKAGSTVHVEGMKLIDDGDNRITMYDSSFKLLQAQNAGNIIPGKSYWFPNYTETENGFSFQILAGYTPCAYIRLSVLTRNIATDPLIAINEEIGYTMEGYLADSIKIKGENVIGGTGGGDEWELLSEFEVGTTGADVTRIDLSSFGKNEFFFIGVAAKTEEENFFYIGAGDVTEPLKVYAKTYDTNVFGHLYIMDGQVSGYAGWNHGWGGGQGISALNPSPRSSASNYTQLQFHYFPFSADNTAKAHIKLYGR